MLQKTTIFTNSMGNKDFGDFSIRGIAGNFKRRPYFSKK